MNATQAEIPIQEIKDDLVFLKNGSISIVLTTQAVNFGLLFETEQLGIIQSFAGLLNSLSFPIQIIIRSKKLDVSAYLNTLDLAMQSQTNPELLSLTANYRQFVSTLIKENNVLDKQFFVALNISSAELGILPKDIDSRTKAALPILSPRIEHLVRSFARIGLKARQLQTLELIKLFYDLYNVEDSEQPKITPAKSDLVSSSLKPDGAWRSKAAASPYYQPIPHPLNTPSSPTTPTLPTLPTSAAKLTTPFVVEELPDGN